MPRSEPTLLGLGAEQGLQLPLCSRLMGTAASAADGSWDLLLPLQTGLQAQEKGKSLNPANPLLLLLKTSVCAVGPVLPSPVPTMGCWDRTLPLEQLNILLPPQPSLPLVS